MWLIVTLETSNELQTYPWYSKHEEGVIIALENRLISIWKSCTQKESFTYEQECLLGFLLVAAVQNKAFTTEERVSALILCVNKPLEIFIDKYSKAAKDAATLVACLFSCADKSLFNPNVVSKFISSLLKFLQMIAKKLYFIAPESCSVYFYFVSQIISAVMLREIVPLTVSMHGFSEAVLNLLKASDVDLSMSVVPGAKRSVIWDSGFLSLASAALRYDRTPKVRNEIFLRLAKALVQICGHGKQGKICDVLRLFLIVGDLILDGDPKVMEEVQIMLFREDSVIKMAMRTLCYLIEAHRDIRSARWVLHFLNAALPNSNTTFLLIANILPYFDSVVVVFNTLFPVTSRSASNSDGCDPALSELRLQALNLLENIIVAYENNRNYLQNSVDLPNGVYGNDSEVLSNLLRPLTAESGGLTFFYQNCLNSAPERERFADITLALATCFRKSPHLRMQLFQYVCDCALRDLHRSIADPSKVPVGPAIKCARVALLALCEVLPPLEDLDNVPDESFVPDNEKGRPSFEMLSSFGGYFKTTMETMVRLVLSSDSDPIPSEWKRRICEVARLLLVVYTVVVALQVKIIELGTEKVQKHVLRLFKNEVEHASRSLDTGSTKAAVSSVITSDADDDSFVRIAGNLLRKAGRIIQI